MERVALALLSLADKIDANELTPELATFKHKSSIEAALITKKRRNEYGYVDTYEFYATDAKSVALQEIIDVATLNGSAQSKDAKADSDNFVRNCDVPGYFPTPTATADDLITEADLGAESVSVLEPSAGDGAIGREPAGIGAG